MAAVLWVVEMGGVDDGRPGRDAASMRERADARGRLAAATG
jgi:hypothetical protein